MAPRVPKFQKGGRCLSFPSPRRGEGAQRADEVFCNTRCIGRIGLLETIYPSVSLNKRSKDATKRTCLYLPLSTPHMRTDIFLFETACTEPNVIPYLCVMDKKLTPEAWLSAAECALRTGLTVRALRLYERHGLITPRRTDKNWRLYGIKDVERLNEIIILKGFGLSLTQIAKLLRGQEADLNRVLSLQQTALTDLRSKAEKGLALINALRQQMTDGAHISINDLVLLAKEISMTQQTQDSVAWKRYEQSRPRTEAGTVLADYDDYAGHYQVSEQFVIEIIRRDKSLLARPTGQPEIEIYPEAEDVYFYKVVSAQIYFQRDADGEVIALVLHQEGLEQPGRRIASAKAKELEERFEDRIRQNKPYPGSEAVLKRLIDEARSGQVDWSWKSEAFRLTTEKWVDGMQTWMAKLGAVKSHAFLGVNRRGWDVYRVTLDHGSVEWSFSQQSDGILDGEWIRDLPRP
jgi:DNA-binding transcriptional MerR regulator